MLRQVLAVFGGDKLARTSTVASEGRPSSVPLAESQRTQTSLAIAASPFVAAQLEPEARPSRGDSGSMPREQMCVTPAR